MNFSCARNFAVVALVSFTLTGCFDDTKETGPVHDVKWFKAHDNDRKATLEECANNPGELKDTPNCLNALEAEKQLSSDSLRDVIDDTKETGPVHDVKWFKTHDNDRKTTLEECANNPGELKDTPNCLNALEAEKQLSSGSLRDVSNW